jgi:hypothetical protein
MAMIDLESKARETAEKFYNAEPLFCHSVMTKKACIEVAVPFILSALEAVVAEKDEALKKIQDVINCSEYSAQSSHARLVATIQVIERVLASQKPQQEE